VLPGFTCLKVCLKQPPFLGRFNNFSLKTFDYHQKFFLDVQAFVRTAALGEKSARVWKFWGEQTSKICYTRIRIFCTAEKIVS
jgi:hypothetical protein